MTVSFNRFLALVGAIFIALVLAGCLKFPLGNPETAAVDPALVGDWFKRGDDNAVTIWHVSAYDARTYLAMQYQAKPDGNGGWERAGMIICKMWLTEIAGQKFACMQLLSSETDKPYIAMKYQLSGESVVVQVVSSEFVDKQDPASAAEFATLVEKNIDNKDLFLSPEKFEKASDADKETINAIRNAFH